jgi:uncharacterized beta-barrel protein YwiB (DUF1934 family)
MKQKAVLSIRGCQKYEEQEPEVIELVTEGTLEYRDDGWDLRYEESELTGLAGVTTLFRIEGDKVVLTRNGNLSSQMIFQEGVFHESLYQAEFGITLMITVCAGRVAVSLDETGGTVDLTYAIEIEQTAAGVIDYHLDIKAIS